MVQVGTHCTEDRKFLQLSVIPKLIGPLRSSVLLFQRIRASFLSSKNNFQHKRLYIGPHLVSLPAV